MYKKLIRKIVLSISICMIFLLPSLAYAAPETPIIGQICLMGFDFVPKGWAECDGKELSKEGNTALFSYIGNDFGGDGLTTFALPDLREASPIPGAKYYIALSGIFPAYDNGNETDRAFIGQIGLFPYGFAPKGWEKCDGKLLNRASYSELYNVIGNQFGGDGSTTFAVPDLEDSKPLEKLDYYIVRSGIVPKVNAYSTGSESLLGSIDLHVSNADFSGNGICDGGLLDMAQNTTLFSLIGKRYGRDVQFAKPDLRGAVPHPRLAYSIQMTGILPTKEIK